MIRAFLWHISNVLAHCISLLGLGLICWIVYAKISLEPSNFFFRSWWHTTGLILLIVIIIGTIMNYVEERMPQRISEKRELKTELRKERDAVKKESDLARTGSNIDALAIGAIGGYLLGKNRAGKGSFRVETWSTRKTGNQGVRGGNSAVFKDRDQAFSKAYDAMDRNPKGEVKVIDQSNHQVILKLP